MKLEDSSISEIQDANTRKYFIDLMKSEGSVRVLIYANVISICFGLFIYGFVYITAFSQDQFLQIAYQIMLEHTVKFTIISMVVLSLFNYIFFAHNALFKIKILNVNYLSTIDDWIITQKFNIQRLDENIYTLKPNNKSIKFLTILFTVDDGYAIILAPFWHLKGFAKVFE